LLSLFHRLPVRTVSIEDEEMKPEMMPRPPSVLPPAAATDKRMT